MNILLIKTKIDQKYPHFGKNKKQLFTRLVYEIAKREYLSFQDVISQIPSERTEFNSIKFYLLKRRFPHLNSNELKSWNSFPDVSLPNEAQVNVDQRPSFYPKKIYIEESVADFPFTKRVCKNCPGVPTEIISTYKDFCKNKTFNYEDYNRRAENFFIVKENFDFQTACPCTKNCLSCGYQILNLGMGCAFECEYCYLQSYTNSPGILLPANIDDYFAKFQFDEDGMRLGNGQFTDSLIYDHITEYSKDLISFFRAHPKVLFEFKTKSDNINHILNTELSSNIVMAWSLNSQTMIKACEHFTSSFDERLQAAKQCAKHGYKIAFHFDPIIFYKGYESDYEEVIRKMFEAVPANQIVWISLGTLRMTMEQKLTIEKRFPQNVILNEEFCIGFDEKIRYPDRLREQLYRHLFANIRLHSDKVPVYLCMEHKNMHL